MTNANSINTIEESHAGRIIRAFPELEGKFTAEIVSRDGVIVLKAEKPYTTIGWAIRWAKTNAEKLAEQETGETISEEDHRVWALAAKGMSTEDIASANRIPEATVASVLERLTNLIGDPADFRNQMTSIELDDGTVLGETDSETVDHALSIEEDEDGLEREYGPDDEDAEMDYFDEEGDDEDDEDEDEQEVDSLEAAEALDGDQGSYDALERSLEEDEQDEQTEETAVETIEPTPVITAIHRNVACPECNAEVGKPCRYPSHFIFSAGHVARRVLSGESEARKPRPTQQHRTVACPRCKEDAGHPCRYPSGHILSAGHAERRLLSGEVRTHLDENPNADKE